MDVDDFMAGLRHTRTSEIERIRRAILASDPGLTESIKWNAPNFAFDGEDRITFRLQPGDKIDLILHRGARKRDDSATFVFDDTAGLIRWAAPDRGVITITEGADLDQLLPTVLPVLHAWVRA